MMTTAAASSEPTYGRVSVPLGSDAESLAGLRFGRTDHPLDIVFLHANGFNALTYRSLLAPLGSDLHILALDQRGHGGTHLPTDTRGRRSWNDLAADLVAVLDRLDGPPVTLAGHSMGGTVSILAASKRPERVRRLVLFEPVILPRLVSMAMRLGFPARRFKNLSALAGGASRRNAVFPAREAALKAYTGRGAFKSWPDGQVADYVADGFRDRPDGTVELACAPGWEASGYLSQAHDVWGALSRLRCPVEILRAARGSTCAPTEPLRPGMTVETVPGTSHFLPMEVPDRARKALRGEVPRP